MGVNCQGLYTVIHYGPPAGLDDYLQEIGRAGRDGLQSNAVLVNYPSCLSSKNILKTVKDYVRNSEKKCKRDIILSQFESSRKNVELSPHHCCDICAKTCKYSGEYCGYIPNEQYEWWKCLVPKTKKSAPKGTLPEPAKEELQSTLSDLRNSMVVGAGHFGPDLLSGFPKSTVQKVVNIASSDLNEKTLDKETAILNRACIPEILGIVQNVCRKFNVKSLPSTDFTESTLSEESSSVSNEDSDNEINFHVNLRISGDSSEDEV